MQKAQPTTLKYMEHGALLKDTATVIAIETIDANKIALILDQTIFYPQGGGQPYDQGTITGPDGQTFVVDEVRFKDGIVFHFGTATNGTFTNGTKVTLSVDPERRQLNNRNHTAGHLIDIAMRTLKVGMIPTRGHHFPEGAYVEYQGTMEEEDRAALKEALQNEVNKLVAQDLPVSVSLISLDELKKTAGYVPDYIPKDKPCRAMIVNSYPAIPCGGTHVTSTQEVQRVVITKVKNKKGNVRIGYTLENLH